MLLAAALLLSWGGNQGMAVPRDGTAVETKQQAKKVTQKERDQAAARALQKGALNPLMITAQPAGAEATAMAAAAALPGQAPHYFSHPNYANSPLPTVTGATIAVGETLTDRAYASDFPVNVGELAPAFVVLPQELPNGFLTSFETWNQATTGASPFPSAGNVFHAYILRPTGVANEYTVVFDSGLLTVPALTVPATSAPASYGVGNLAVQAGDRIAFYGQGIPVDTGSGSAILSYPAPTPPLQDSTITLGSTDYPIYPQARTYSFRAQVIDMSPAAVTITGGIKKFKDQLPTIPAAVPETVTYNGIEADFYRIGLVEYTQQMH